MAALGDPSRRRAPLALETLLLLLVAAVAVIGLCATAAVRKKRNRSDKQTGEVLLSTWKALKKALVMSLHGGEGEDVVESEDSRVEPEAEERGTPVLPLWKRRILMGERCELPQFSGLILYDEGGRPICSNSSHGTLFEVSDNSLSLTDHHEWTIRSSNPHTFAGYSADQTNTGRDHPQGFTLIAVWFTEFLEL
ncbi:unnamed protein product [Musa acuminata subsp. malaccensis]|uniref:(wild Malaysian banana) hypothetical protein n=1 Tax=Musa acuminata subsp. malaccensis TaxID=214687 RepID=A0A804JGG1_MUSAM|nr:unnamed protein product [Musa acuminata subsp. malaccensis]